MHGHAEKCVDKYLELTGSTESVLKPVSTPSLLSHLIHADEFKVKGKLADNCTRVVLKILFFAHISRPDVLGVCNQLSREVSRWTAACDRQLHRLISYIHFTKRWVLKCHIGNSINEFKLAIHSDASFAGDPGDRSRPQVAFFA